MRSPTPSELLWENDSNSLAAWRGVRMATAMHPVEFPNNAPFTRWTAFS